MLKFFTRRKNGGTANRVFLAAFGKHPGWDDHIEDLGLDTEQLVRVKRTLYVEGISGNVDSGAWDKLSETQRLGGFNHLFLWRTPADIVAGQIWSSADGKGRTRYPMIVCAQCLDLPLPWILKRVLPRLEEVRTQCINTTSAPLVRSVVDAARRDLRELAREVETSPQDPETVRGTLSVLADHSEMGKDHIGLLRILYMIEQGMPVNNARSGDKTSRVLPSSLHIRVPACTDSAQDSVLLWLSFLFGEIDTTNSVLLLLPQGESWVDIIIGSPTTKDLYCIRASREALPPTTDIPYTLDPDFRERAEQRISASRTVAKEACSARSNSS